MASALSSGDSPRVRRARKIATVFDDYYVDPIVGFVLPGAGDALSALFGFYVVGLAIQEKVPGVVVARMLLNLAIDALVGVVPLLGDLFDVAYKAHSRNLALLERRHRQRRSSLADWAIVVGAVLLTLAAVTLPFALAYAGLRKLLS